MAIARFYIVWNYYILYQLALFNFGMNDQKGILLLLGWDFRESQQRLPRVHTHVPRCIVP